MKILNKSLLVICMVFLTACAQQVQKPADVNPIEINPITDVQKQQFDQAVIAIKKQQWSQAEKLLLPLLKQHQDLQSVMYNLAMTYRQSRQYGKSVNGYKKLLKLYPEDKAAWLELGLAYRQQGQFTPALKAYQKALKIDSEYAEVQFNLGILYDIYLKQPAKALKHYKAYQQVADSESAEVAVWIKQLEPKSEQEAQADD